MGAERKSLVMSEEEKMLTAYHEAGHAIVGLNVPAGIPVHKATIIPRGRAMGMVKFLPEGDRYSMKYKEFTSQLAVAMGAASRRRSPSARTTSPPAPPLTSSRRPRWRKPW